MKVAYLSTYRDGTDYGNAAINQILACESAGIDVVCRPITLTSLVEQPCLVSHLEDKDLKGVDVVIQHTLPHVFEYKRGVKNIGYFKWDTTHFRRANWASCCNMMDEIWVPCDANVDAARNSGVNKPIKVIPYACDESRFSDKIEPLDIPQLKNRFVLYSIGEMTRRQNFAGLLRAYYAAFTSRDDVILLVKTSMSGMAPDQVVGQMKEFIANIKKSIHMYIHEDRYPPVIVLADSLSEDQMGQLHKTCDVFVLPTKGEGWSPNMHNAMGFGNPVIASDCCGISDLFGSYLEREQSPGILIDGAMTPCFGMVESFPDLYTGDELWFEPDVEYLIDSMKFMYSRWRQDRSILLEMSSVAGKRAMEFSRENVGQIILETLRG